MINKKRKEKCIKHWGTLPKWFLSPSSSCCLYMRHWGRLSQRSWSQRQHKHTHDWMTHSTQTMWLFLYVNKNKHSVYIHYKERNKHIMATDDSGQSDSTFSSPVAAVTGEEMGRKGFLKIDGEPLAHKRQVNHDKVQPWSL